MTDRAGCSLVLARDSTEFFQYDPPRRLVHIADDDERPVT